MAMTLEQEREAFEKWYVEHAFDYEKNPIGSREFCIAWDAWQARAHLTPPAQAVDVGAISLDGTDNEVLSEFIRLCREAKPVGRWPGERVCVAIERLMANQKPFRFIAESDKAPERGHNGRGGDGDRVFSGPQPTTRALSAEKAGWREFIEGCANSAGGWVDGTHLSERAKCLLTGAKGAVWTLDSDGYKTYWPSAEIAERERANLATLGFRATVTPPTSNGWRPIETAPKDGSSVLLYVKHCDVPCIGYWRDVPGDNGNWEADKYHYSADGNDVTSDVWSSDVTHWMPLPASPTPDKEG